MARTYSYGDDDAGGKVELPDEAFDLAGNLVRPDLLRAAVEQQQQQAARAIATGYEDTFRRTGRYGDEAVYWRAKAGGLSGDAAYAAMRARPGRTPEQLAASAASGGPAVTTGNPRRSALPVSTEALNPQRSALPVSTEALPAAGVIQSGLTPDPYGSFKDKFRELTGRDITQEEIQDPAFINSLSNSLIRLLPRDRMISLSNDRLWSLPNDVLTDLPSDRLLLLPNERLNSLSKSFLSGFVQDQRRRTELGLSVTASAGANPSSAGPSAGPNLGMVWPGYNSQNPNVEQQYAEWRDKRSAAGEDPYDMAAFRQHLIGMEVPDPGEPNPVPVGQPPGAPPASGAPPSPTPAGPQPAPEAPPPVIPGTPPASTAPGTPPPTAPGTPPAPPGVPPAPGTPSTGNDIPKDKPWIVQVGAQDWASRLRASGIPWSQITQTQLRTDMSDAWGRRSTNPKYAAIYKLAQQYFATTGWWPTEVEFNRYTQHLPNMPQIIAQGDTDLTLTPKAKGAPSEGTKWEVPTDAEGHPRPSPPGYDWYFSSDGTPKQLKNDQSQKDVFSGWYMDPRSKQWTYDPLVGAADYLNSSDPSWRAALVQFTQSTGRLPNLTEARNIATRTLWAKADQPTQDRASQFASLNGFWPTPWELENGPSHTPDANKGGGAQNAAGVGTVPVYVPGVGVVLTQGTPMGAGGMVFDPFAGIPGSVSPWVRELLNGRITADQVPQDIRPWADYALQKFRDQMPVKHPNEIPWGIPAPHLGDSQSRSDSDTLNKNAGKPPVEDPNVTVPTTMPDGTLHIPPSHKAGSPPGPWIPPTPEPFIPEPDLQHEREGLTGFGQPRRLPPQPLESPSAQPQPLQSPTGPSTLPQTPPPLESEQDRTTPVLGLPLPPRPRPPELLPPLSSPP